MALHELPMGSDFLWEPHGVLWAFGNRQGDPAWREFKGLAQRAPARSDKDPPRAGDGPRAENTALCPMLSAHARSCSVMSPSGPAMTRAPPTAR